ncbi:MAG: glycosyltransferase family 2 protein, partial [Elusimicrobia bacterium]|nr:glycosyltransferase family 2 protein [Elusimicrobiota bacterium]
MTKDIKKLESVPVSVILPAYNEADSLQEEITRIKKVLTDAQISFEMIVVDDGSTDNTSQIAQSQGVRVIRHPKNRGVGAARKTGILAAQNEIIVTTDADGTYPQEPIPAMLDHLTRNGYDMVVGARRRESGTAYWIRLPAKFLIRKLASYLCREKIPDLNSGLRIFKKTIAL